MLRIATFLLIAILSYLGITALIEHQNPEVTLLSSTVPEPDSTLPPQVLGQFEIDAAASKKWLHSQSSLSHETQQLFTQKHKTQTRLSFDGKALTISNLAEATPVELLDVTDRYVKIKLEGKESAFLQWDKNGGLWYDTYIPLQTGKNVLYRARYVRAQPK